MRRKVLLFSAMMFMSMMAWADGTSYTGIFFITPDEKTAYALSEQPVIRHLDVEGKRYVALYVNDELVARYCPSGDDVVSIIYGTYESDPTGIGDHSSGQVRTYTREGRKYITGGRLVIVGKDGRQYDASGRRIK